MIHLHKNDLPSGLDFGPMVAMDTETMGLNPQRDRLCLVQLSDGKGDAHLVQFDKGHYTAPHLKQLLSDPNRLKIFHFARFDIAIIQHYLNLMVTPLFCTKIASRLCRTYTDSHGLKELCRELLGVPISKQQQSSDWGGGNLTKEQQEYAASDVLHLHALRDKLTEMLVRENRLELAQQCFSFLPARAILDLEGWPEIDVFAH